MTRTEELSKQLGVQVMSDQDFKIKMAVEKALADHGIVTKQAKEDLIVKVVMGVLAVAGIVFVLALCAILRDARPWGWYYRRYYWY